MAIQSNLEGFLHCVTPIPSSSLLPKSCINELNSLWQPAGDKKDVIEYFSLGDLWDCYNEWSAYGAGTSISLNTGETVMQYYVPYLSAIQIYSNKSVEASRSPRGCVDAAEFESDSWSDESTSDKLSRSFSNNSNSSRNWDSIFEDSSSEHEVASPINDRLGYLYFQYFEKSSPYLRVPLLEKITELANDYPGLMTLRNVDLSPASWMAVAWYPIYHIPSLGSEKDLSTCFLTYHTLSSSFLDYEDMNDEKVESVGSTGTKRKQGNGGIPLTPFGLATYKLHGDLWLNPETSDPDRMMTLQSAADSWLKQLHVQHQDYSFFTYHSNM